jgi:hypothetical protein
MSDPAEFEMLRPVLRSRVKKPLDFARVGVDAGQVRPLEQIAARTGHAQVRGVVGSAMLPSDDVLNVVGKFDVSLVDPAVFATALGAPPDERFRFSIH